MVTQRYRDYFLGFGYIEEWISDGYLGLGLAFLVIGNYRSM